MPYSIRLASTQAALESSYRLRHEVYCEDFGFEEPRDDGLEIDRYDWRSTSILAYSGAADAAPVGCLRVVRPGSSPGLCLPCEDLFERPLMGVGDGTYGEISRLAVSRASRAHALGPQGAPSDLNHRVVLNLYIGVLAYAQAARVETMCMLVEPRLQLNLTALGIRCEARSEPIEHRGQRSVISFDTSEAIAGLRGIYRSRFDSIASELHIPAEQHSGSMAAA